MADVTVSARVRAKPDGMQYLESNCDPILAEELVSGLHSEEQWSSTHQRLSSIDLKIDCSAALEGAEKADSDGPHCSISVIRSTPALGREPTRP